MEDQLVMAATQFRLCEDFSDTPGGRKRETGEFSGEEFRESHLLPLLKKSEVEVNLDGALGLPPSFLDESFGVLARKHPELVKRLKVFVSDNPTARRILTDLLPTEALLWLRK
jgi:hypothetical protein